MKISFENPDKINGLLTMTIEEADYKEKVEKTLKDYKKKANVPGFRPGQVPIGMIKRQYGAAVKVDEINKIVGEQLYKYISDNKIEMLGEPLVSEKQKQQNIEKDTELEFVFDIAVAPEFKCELTGRDKIDYYNIKVDDEQIQKQIDAYTSRFGEYKETEKYEGNDMLKGELRELEQNGSTKENGITVADAILMPSYIKVEEQKKLFDNAKVGDIITFNPKKAYPESTVEIASLLKVDKKVAENVVADFSYQITEIKHFEKALVDQKLFDNVFGKDKVKNEEEFKKLIADDIQAQFNLNSDYKFMQDVRDHCEKKVGKLTFPDEMLKKIMAKNTKNKPEDFVEKNYDASIKELTWHLIKEKLVKANDIKIDNNDIKEGAKESAKIQFAQYGMANVPEEYLEDYAMKLLEKKENAEHFMDMAINKKLGEKLKTVVKLNEKNVTLEEFSKDIEKKDK